MSNESKGQRREMVESLRRGKRGGWVARPIESWSVAAQLAEVSLRPALTGKIVGEGHIVVGRHLLRIGGVDGVIQRVRQIAIQRVPPIVAAAIGQGRPGEHTGRSRSEEHTS